MSDNWGHYFADIGGHQGSVLFDDGLSASIDQLKLSHAVKIKLSLREHNGNGLPTNAEADRLNHLADIYEPLITQLGGAYLGRMSYNEMRWELFLVNSPPQDLHDTIKQIATDAEYKVDTIIKPDPAKAVYWEDLYPDADSRQIMNDMRVLASLDKNGDNRMSERPIDHWVDFETKKTAETYVDWLKAEKLTVVEISSQKEGLLKKTWCVKAQHIGNTDFVPLTNMTLKLSRKARELNGIYNGWGTEIVNL